MKTVAISLITLILFACSGRADKKTTPTKQLPDSSAVSQTSQDKENVDAISSATNVGNPMMLNGTLIVPAENNVTITLPMGGSVSSFSHLPGEYVKKGETIVILENTEFIDLQQTYLEAAAQTEFLEAEYVRQQALSVEDATSQKKLQQSRADYLSMKSRKNATAARLKMLGVVAGELGIKGISEKLEVKAPQSGYISEVMVNKGKYVAAGEAICQIINKNQILLDLIAYEKDLNHIKSGQKLQFKVNGLGDDIFTAIVTAIDQRVDPINRSVKIYAKVITQNQNFRPGMYVIARIK